MVMRIKFTELDEMTSEDHMEEVIKHCMEKLKIRINEEEEPLLNDGDANWHRSGAPKRLKS